MKEIVICSGEVNRYGYRNIPAGGRLDAYQKNPVLLWGHNREKKSVGKMTGLRLNDDGMLVGTPEFDAGDPDAQDLQRKYENGYLNALSMDHEPLVVSDAPEDIMPGQSRVTVKEWELVEVSCCNIPGDRGAVALSLSKQNLDEVIPLLPTKLSIQSQTQNNERMSLDKISKALGLSADSTEGAIVDEITRLAARVQSAETARIDALIESGKTAGVISDENEDSYRKLSALDYDNASKLLRLAIGKASQEPPAGGDTKLTAKDIIDSVKKLGGEKTTDPKDETFEKLSKENPKRLNEIRKSDPERYAKLAADYAAATN